MPKAARKGDKVKQNYPHCHAPIHPAAPVPTPVPHMPGELAIVASTAGTVFINGQAAALVNSSTAPCSLPSCVPGGPGIIAKGSMTVTIENLPAARVGDLTSHPACVAPIPCPVGKVTSGSDNVNVGG